MTNKERAVALEGYVGAVTFDDLSDAQQDEVLISEKALNEAEKRGMERALAAVEGIGNDVYWTKDEYMYWAKDAIKTKIKKL